MKKLRENLEKLIEMVGRLSDREKLIVLGASAMVFSLLTVSLVLLSVRAIDRASRQVAFKSEQLREIISLRDSYRRAEDQNVAQRSRLARNDLRLVGLVEDEAKKMGIEIGNITPREYEPDVNGVKAHVVELRAQKLSYDKVTTFLERLEAQSNPVKVIRLRLQQRFDEKDLVDMELTVATYKAG